MATIEDRPGKTGTTYRVRWSFNGTRPSPTFANEKDAKACKKLVEGLRHQIDEKDAVRLVLGLEKEPDAQDAENESAPTLNDWWARWREQKNGTQIDTLEGYETQYLKRIKHAEIDGRPFGEYRLAEIRGETVGLWVRQLANDEDDPVMPATVQRYHSLLHQLLRAAEFDGLISVNPAAGTSLPKETAKSRHSEGKNREHTYLTKGEGAQLVAAIQDDVAKRLVLLLLGTGMRWGEATELRTKDIILGDREWGKNVPTHVSVSRAWKHSKSRGWYVGPPKSKRSRRKIQLSRKLSKMLIKLVDSAWTEKQLFSWDGKTRIDNKEFVTYQLDPAIRLAGFDKRPLPHDLRHTHASWLIADGWPLPAIQRRLGHEKITTTIDTYGHLLPDIDDEYLPLLDAALPSLD